MPESVQNAVPSTVMPWNLCKAFVHAREYPIIENEYRGGESQRSRQADTSRKRWQLSKRLIPAELALLRDFYFARSGPHEPFFFYDVWETSPKYSYDPAGAETTGRYTVRFDCPWGQSVGLSRADVELSLVELT